MPLPEFPPTPPHINNEIKRHSPIVLPPTLGDRGQPINDWRPSEIVTEDWGAYEILVDDENVTLFRGTLSKLVSYTFTEPFGPETAVLRFAQVTPFEVLGEGGSAEADGLAWCHLWATVEINQVRNGTLVGPVWEGQFVSFKDVVEEGQGYLEVQCTGPAFWLNNHLQPPQFSNEEVEIVDAVALAMDPITDLYDLPLMHLEIPVTPPTMKTRLKGSWQPILTGYITELLAQAMSEDGSKWTIGMLPGRRPTFVKKDMDTIHWTAYVATPGITHDLDMDATIAPNIIYGEGTDDGNCHWRNTKFPYLTTFTPTKPIGEPFFQPIAVIDVVEPFIYDEANGGAHPVTPNNPAFDSTYVRVERYVNYGQHVLKEEGEAAAAAELAVEAEPVFQGSMTFRLDPEEGSRLDMRAGQNLKYKGHRGVDTLYHISKVSVDVDSLAVTCELDPIGRDWLQLTAIRSRDRELSDPARKQKSTRRHSSITEDRKPVWDCESGAGIVPRTRLPKQTWVVRQIPAAASGSIVYTEFTLDYPDRFAVGLFDNFPGNASGWTVLTDDSPGGHGGGPHPPRDTIFSPSAAAAYMLSVIGPQGPLDFFGGSTGASIDPWDLFADDTSGLIAAWGGPEQGAGYYPGRESDGGEPTGKLVDAGTLYYNSSKPPFLWVAMWAELATNNYITGRFFPSQETF